MEQQVVHAIETAFNPAADPGLIQQALQYVEQLRSEPSAWQPCLSIFTKSPRYSQVVRHMSLDIVSNAVRSANIGQDSLDTAKSRMLEYLRETYGSADPSLAEMPAVQNKVAQILTDFFALFYASGWESFFNDILSLTGSAGNWDNPAGIILYLRVIISIHDDIGDTTISRSTEEQRRATTLKDLVRQRDVQKIAQSWREILSLWREGNDLIAELCLKAVGRYVSWIDISLVVNQSMLDLLFQQLGRAQKTELKEGEERARDAAINVFSDIVSKKMKPSDKIEMISFLNLENVIAQLIASPPLNQHRFSSQYDTDLAETVAILVDTTVVDIVKTLEVESQDSETWQRAEVQLEAFLPLTLRFFSDEYDEVCSTVIRSLNDVLSFLRKSAKDGPPSPQRAVMLLPILKALIAKMRYDETSSWGDDDEETDEAEFQELRKRLNVLQQIIAATDEQLYIDVLSDVVGRTFDNLRAQGPQLDWRDLDLALHEMYQFGDLAVKQGGLYNKNKPNSPAAEKLVEMMLKMVESDIQSFNHPATQLQYMETCVRYSSFFEHHTQFITPVLENFLRLVHHPVLKVKTRSWYLFQRLVRQLRSHVGDIAQTIIEALGDLLSIQAELPQDGGDAEDMSSEDHDTSADAVFNSQLYLFEAIGCICGSPAVPLEKQVFLTQSVMSPTFSNMERSLPPAKAGDERAILQIHHDIMALGTVAAGFSDRTPGTTSSGPGIPQQVQQSFARVSEATLVALESLKTAFDVRSAARFAFSRLVPVLGANILPQLPRWIEGLLTQTSTKDEMALFLRLLDQVIFGFKTEIYNILDTLLTPFLQRVFSGIAEPIAGTDDEIQLAELKREYLNFLLVILNNELGAVLVSSANQPMFETVISTMEHFTKDLEDFPTAKMAFQVLSRMSSIWGGPDIVVQPGQQNGTPTAPPQPALQGFDRFMIARFSPLCWALPMTPSFNPKDAQAKQVLAEAANLQKAIYAKTGQEYLSWLRTTELRNLNMDDGTINEYLRRLEGLDQKEFRQYFQNFVQAASG